MITNAKIVGTEVSMHRYSHEEAQRGDLALVIRAHILSEVLRNAQRWVKGYVSPESKAKEFGSLLDCVLLTPMEWPRLYAILPEDAPRRPSERQRNAKKQSESTLESIRFWDKFERENPGQIITQELNASAHSAANRLKQDPMIRDLLDGSGKQVMVVAQWQDKETGLMVPLKCLIDIEPHREHPVFGNGLWDLKTTANASGRSFSRDAMKYRYDLQGAFYLDMFNATGEPPRSDFGHIVVENYHPYEFRTPPPLLSQRFLDYGRLSYQRALAVYCRALKSGVWPSYDPRNGQWPITDCDDWFLSLDQLFDPIQEPDTEPEAEQEPIGVTP